MVTPSGWASCTSCARMGSVKGTARYSLSRLAMPPHIIQKAGSLARAASDLHMDKLKHRKIESCREYDGSASSGGLSYHLS